MLPGVERGQHDVVAKAALVIALIAAALPGCCEVRQRHACRGAAIEPNLVFNPPGMEVFAADQPRTPWPSAFAYDDPGETIAYRETIMDRQGWFGAENDRPYRRFDSVRIGYVRR